MQTKTRDKEGYYMMITGAIHQEEITIINIHTPNMGTFKYKKQIQTVLKEQADNNIPCSATDRSFRDKIKREQWTQTIY